VEPLSLDEAFVDLRAATPVVGFGPDELTALVARLKADLATVTGGLTASVGVASSKFMAKIATELDKPDGLCVIEPGTEVERLGPMRVGVIPGVGPVTQDKLRRIGVQTVADLRGVAPLELAQVVGRAHAETLVELAYARDDRPVVPEREAKSISVEDTFEHDLTDRAELAQILQRDAGQVAERLGTAGLFARTVSIKVRRHDFSTLTRSRTLAGATDRAGTIAEVAASLLAAVDVTEGVRLLGVGVAGLTDLLQEDLFAAEPAGEGPVEETTGTDQRADPGGSPEPTREPPRWTPGRDVVHTEHGPGWVWGSGLGRVTVRFETAETGPGPVRTFATDDPALRPVGG
jgi:DNA polymerase-4